MECEVLEHVGISPLRQHVFLARRQAAAAAARDFTGRKGRGAVVQLPHAGVCHRMQRFATLARHQCQKVSNQRDFQIQHDRQLGRRGHPKKTRPQVPRAAVVSQRKRRF